MESRMDTREVVSLVLLQIKNTIVSFAWFFKRKNPEVYFYKHNKLILLPKKVSTMQFFKLLFET